MGICLASCNAKASLGVGAGGTLFVRDKSGLPSKVVIPKEVGGAAVTSIGEQVPSSARKAGLASPHQQAGNQDFPSAGQDGAGSAGLRRKTKDNEFRIEIA